MRKWRKNSI